MWTVNMIAKEMKAIYERFCFLYSSFMTDPNLNCFINLLNDLSEKFHD